MYVGTCVLCREPFKGFRSNLVWLGVEAVSTFARSEFVLLSRTVQRNVWQVLCSDLGQETDYIDKGYS